MECDASQRVGAEPSGRLVEVCPGCGYSLAGSPDAGTCPECGRAYDQSALVLHGGAMGRRATLANASPRAIAGVLLFGFFQTCQLWNAAFGPGRSAEAAWFVGAAAVALAGLVLARRLGSNHPGHVIAYFSPSGCVQFDRSPPGMWVRVVQAYTWFAVTCAVFVPMIPVAVRLVSVLAAAALLTVAVGLWAAGRARRPAPVDPAWLPPAEAVSQLGVVWSRVARVFVTPSRSGHLRVHATRATDGHDPVDLEVVGDEARGRWLAATIERLRRARPGGEGGSGVGVPG